MSNHLPVGKLKAESLKTLLSKYSIIDDTVVVGPSIGEDAAVIDFGDRYLVATTDPVTFATDEIGWYTLHINANDIATRGARPKWLLATMLFPEGKTTEETVEAIFSQISKACQDLGVSLIGGHTEITSGIDRPIVVGQMLGEVEKDALVSTSGAQVGDDIVLTKGIAIEATSLLARERADVLGVTFSQEFLERCRKFLHKPGISILRDAEIAVQVAEIHAMHDPTEGGVAMGLHETCEAAGVGLIVYREKIPVFPETVQLCRHFHLNPLGVIASGALLICVAPEEAPRVIDALSAENITASIIGKIVEKGFGAKMKEKGKFRNLPRFERDEIAKVFE